VIRDILVMNADCNDLLWMLSCSGRSPVTLDTLRQAAKAGEDGSKSQLHKSFYTSVPSECLDDMAESVVKRMALDFDSSKEHYHVKVWSFSYNAPMQSEILNYDLFLVQIIK
jgi:hypothetical protein